MTLNRNAAVRAVPAVFLAVTSITVLLRCYVRLRLVKAFGWDDGLMVLAMVCGDLATADEMDKADLFTGRLCHVLWRHDRRQSIRHGKTFR